MRCDKKTLHNARLQQSNSRTGQSFHSPRGEVMQKLQLDIDVAQKVRFANPHSPKWHKIPCLVTSFPTAVPKTLLFHLSLKVCVNAAPHKNVLGSSSGALRHVSKLCPKLDTLRFWSAGGVQCVDAGAYPWR